MATPLRRGEPDGSMLTPARRPGQRDSCGFVVRSLRDRVSASGHGVTGPPPLPESARLFATLLLAWGDRPDPFSTLPDRGAYHAERGRHRPPHLLRRPEPPQLPPGRLPRPRRAVAAWLPPAQGAGRRQWQGHPRQL